VHDALVPPSTMLSLALEDVTTADANIETLKLVEIPPT
jgi:hypothetical protein